MKQNFLLKSFVLLIALLAGGISASWGQTTLFSWKSDGSTTTLETSLTATGGTATFYGSAAPSTESATYNTAVTDNDLKATGSKGHKLGTNTLYLKVTLTGNTLQAGDIIYVCGYNFYRIGTGVTSNRADTDLAESLATGTEKTDYNVGSVTVPSTIAAGVTEIYFSRANGSGTGLAAIKIVRPAAATEAFTVTFNAGDYGTCATASLKETSAGAGVTLPAVTPTDGYTFNGWFTAATGGSKAGEAGATYYPTANVTLHAQYTEPVAEPTYKSDFTNGQVIWTTKDEIDAASSGSSPWIVKGDGISNTKDLKGKSFVDPEDEEGDRIAKYSSETPFYIEKTISDKKDLKLYVTGVTRMTFYVWSNSTPDGRVFSIKVNDGDVTDLTFAKGDYNAKYVSVDLEKTANNIIQVYASNELELYAIKAIIDNRAASTFELTSDAAVTLWKDETSTIAFENNAGTVTFSSSDESVATVDADGVITAVAEGTAEITVTDPGSATVMDATEIVTVTVKEHKNTTTENVNGGNNVEVVLSYADDIDTNSAAIKGVATFSDFAGNGGVQDGNSKFTIDGKDYSTIKVSASRQFVITPAPGVEITQVLAYVTSNKDTGDQFKTYYDASGNTHNLETAIDIPDVGETPLELDLTAYYENGFRFEKQSRIVFKITYNTTQQMILEIKETGYATLFTDYAVAIPEGVEAFTGKYNAETQTVQLSAVTGTIPANTAVILHTETPGSYSFIKADDVDAIAIANNDLRGTLVEKTVEAQSVYTLGLGGEDNTVGMRKYNGTKIRAYSAYMEAPANAAPFFNLGYGEEGTTGISSLTPALSNGEGVYTLDGRKLNAMPTQKGVYIVNGKKVVIK